MNKEALKHLKAITEAFGPDAGIELDQKAWSKLHTAIKAALAQPWVGLTDEERMDCIFATNWSKKPLMDTAKLIEAKLKEKNT
jgi:predicted DsbA family dithiol-disulfide isomerase